MMSTVVGILVKLDISGAPGSGTDDPIYLGVMGKQGGREFPLNRSGDNDWEAGSKAYYAIGTVPCEERPDAAPFAARSEPGKRNAPDRFDIGADSIDSVYLRKREGVSSITDDAVSILKANVIIHDSDNGKKHWSLESKLGVWLGTEYGSRVALTRDEDS
jgi:hypothetical protein